MNRVRLNIYSLETHLGLDILNKMDTDLRDKFNKMDYISIVHTIPAMGARSISYENEVLLLEDISNTINTYIDYSKNLNNDLSFEMFLYGLFKPQDMLKAMEARDEKSVVVHTIGDDDWAFYSFMRYIFLYSHFSLSHHPSIVPRYKKYGVHALLNKQGYFQDLFYYDPNIQKEYDVSFVGQIYPHRVEAIKYLVQKGINIKVYGTGWDRYKEFDGIYGGKLSNDELREVIHKSKINLNLSYNISNTLPQPKDRFLIISACRGFQLTEDTDIFGMWYEKDEIGLYDNSLEDLYNKIKYYLENDELREKMADKAYQKTAQHSWDNAYIENIQEIYQTTPKPKPQYYNVVEKYKDKKVYMVCLDDISNFDVLNNQIATNITVVTDHNIDYKNTISVNQFLQEIQNTNDSYVTFIDKHTYLEPEKILFQAYSLDYDREDRVYVNISSYFYKSKDVNFNHIYIRTMAENIPNIKWYKNIHLSAVMFEASEFAKTYNNQKDIIANAYNFILNNEMRYIKFGMQEMVYINNGYMDNKIAQILANSQNIALYGSGVIATKVLEQTKLDNIVVKYIFDSNSKLHNTVQNGVTVINSNVIDQYTDIDTIVISSLAHSTSIYENIKYLEQKGIKIIKLFECYEC